MPDIEIVRLNEKGDSNVEVYSIYSLIHYIFYLMSRGQLGVPSKNKSPIVLSVNMPNGTVEYLWFSLADKEVEKFIIQNVLERPIKLGQSPGLKVMELFDAPNALSERYIKNIHALSEGEAVTILESLHLPLRFRLNVFEI